MDENNKETGEQDSRAAFNYSFLLFVPTIISPHRTTPLHFGTFESMEIP